MLRPTTLLLMLSLLALGRAGRAGGDTPLRIRIETFKSLTKGTESDKFARYATERFTEEIAKAKRFELVKGMEAPAFVAGEFETLRRSKGVCELRLKMRIHDLATLSPINGADERVRVQIDTAPGEDETVLKRTQDEDEDLLKWTMDLTIKKAVKTIVGFQLPEGILTNMLSPGTIVVNRGAKDGIKVGMIFDVFRDGKRVGKVWASNVFATDAEVAALENLGGIQPQDRVRAVFPLSFHKYRGK